MVGSELERRPVRRAGMRPKPWWLLACLAVILVPVVVYLLLPHSARAGADAMKLLLCTVSAVTAYTLFRLLSRWGTSTPGTAGQEDAGPLDRHRDG